jgi:hypothetical protein
LRRIELEILVAGRRFALTFPATPNQQYTFTWDGKDAYGREPAGPRPAIVRIGYTYGAVYRTGCRTEPECIGGLAFLSPGVFNTRVMSRREIIRWRELSVSIGTFDTRGSGLGGWSFDVHHQYDPFSKLLYLGNGNVRGAEALNFDVIDTFAGTGSGQPGANGDGGPATAARIPIRRRLAVAPDGSVYIAEWGTARIRRVSPDGVITTVASGSPTGTVSRRLFDSCLGRCTSCRLPEEIRSRLPSDHSSGLVFGQPASIVWRRHRRWDFQDGLVHGAGGGRRGRINRRTSACISASVLRAFRRTSL